MRVVFMGTPQFAATILEFVATQHDVVAVYTRPDAVRGRGNALVFSPVKESAVKRDIPVHTPKTLRDPEVFAELAAYEPDVICVAAYGMILPKQVLDLPRYGCLNAHASLLPRWRGAAPIERAILAGDEEAGVCVMRMEEGLDTGDYCISRSVEIGSKSSVELTDDLALLASQSMLTALSLVEDGRVRWTIQDEGQVTYADKVQKHELHLNPQDEAALSIRKVRCHSAAHPCRCVIGGKGVAIVAAEVGEADLGLQSGSVAMRNKALYLGCADGCLKLLVVKPDGKKEMEAQAFAAGLQGLKKGLVSWEACSGE